MALFSLFDCIELCLCVPTTISIVHYLSIERQEISKHKYISRLYNTCCGYFPSLCINLRVSGFSRFDSLKQTNQPTTQNPNQIPHLFTTRENVTSQITQPQWHFSMWMMNSGHFAALTLMVLFLFIF